MQQLKKVLLNEYVLVFLFCLAAIHGPAFSLMDTYKRAECVDCQTYLGVAQLQLDQSPVRRYRPIVPALAGSVNYVFGRAFNKLRPLSFEGDFSLIFSFYLVNCLLLSIWGVLIYRFCMAYGAGRAESIVGLLVMLTCRWTPYIAGTPIADSIYCIATGLALLGIKERNERFIVWAIFLGPFAKEAFIFIAPIIFFCSKVPKGRQVVYFILSGILVFSFRYAYDRVAGQPPASGLAADIYHFQYIRENVAKLLSFHGIYDVLSNAGLWLLLPAGAWIWAKSYRQALRESVEGHILLFLAAILVHMLLSGYFERMVYLAMPVICMTMALAVRELRMQYIATKK